MKTKTTDSLQDILKNRTKKFGTFSRVAEKSSDLSLTCQSQPMIDERLMSARATINTSREDREGDIIVPKGVHLENFSKNPVVLWEHGLGEITRPIAKCQHPDGKIALSVEEDQITATSYFTDKSLESLQIFHLIAEGLVRATSVRAVPIKSFTRKTSNDGIGIVLEEWELIEWSWGALGVNPDAIARTLNQGIIEGKKISDTLLKSLKAVLPPTKSLTIPGWTQSDNNLLHENHEVGIKEDQVSPNKNSILKTKATNAVPFDLNDFIRLEKLSQASNLTLPQRQILTGILKQLNPIPCSQFSHDEKKLEQNVEELTHAVEELQQKISDLLPA
ncbi:hypothetical protein [Gimesia aquarii]|uniref:Caudovirus prohead protease n=1 Tax=Gimesia aquarii TaxID=2527964 RepID=A0A517VP06_9PLAN|nr:hypothetical protein [Gimesia aquarii]QDT94739.1 hypothetical protein V144x_01700 [Gimesia aquarii]